MVAAGTVAAGSEVAGTAAAGTAAAAGGAKKHMIPLKPGSGFESADDAIDQIDI